MELCVHGQLRIVDCSDLDKPPSTSSSPLHLFNKEALFSVAQLIGTPLKLDASTITFACPSVAGVCVEIDLQQPRPDEVWIGNGESGFWQPICYENRPPFCNFCHKIRHDRANCHTENARRNVPPSQLHPMTHLEYRLKNTRIPDTPAQPPSDVIPTAPSCEFQPSTGAAASPDLPHAAQPMPRLEFNPNVLQAAVPPPVATTAQENHAPTEASPAASSLRSHVADIAALDPCVAPNPEPIAPTLDVFAALTKPCPILIEWMASAATVDPLLPAVTSNSQSPDPISSSWFSVDGLPATVVQFDALVELDYNVSTPPALLPRDSSSTFRPAFKVLETPSRICRDTPLTPLHIPGLQN